MARSRNRGPSPRRAAERWSRRLAAPAAALSLLSPATAEAAAPSIPMFGSFFPWWLLCLFAAILATVILRVGFVLIGLDDILRWRVPVYMSLALALTYLFSLLFFGR